MWRRALKLLYPTLLCIVFFLHADADVGTAAFYGPPFLPTVCYGDDSSQFPTSDLFAAVGEGIWDNGASCGREYLVRCLSSATRKACMIGETIQVKVVDRATMLNSLPSRNGTTMVLSTTAFQMIANQSANMINIEFSQEVIVLSQTSWGRLHESFFSIRPSL